MKRMKIIVIFLVYILLVSIFPINVASNSTHKNYYLKNEKTQDDNTNFYALIAACSRYENPNNNLPRFSPFPDEKLKVLYDSLIESENWDEKNIILLLNENATKENITNALEHISEIVGPDDVFIFSWQGHGSVVKDDDGDEKNHNPKDEYDEVIIPYDNKSFIRDDELGYYFSKIKAKGMCLIFESCLSGGLVDRGRNLIFIDSIDDKNEIGVLDVNDENRIIIMSTLSTTVCKASRKFGFPMTYCLAQAFKGKAKDSDKDGFISVEEAFKFARFRTIFSSNLDMIPGLVMGFILIFLLGSSNPIFDWIWSIMPMFLSFQLFARITTGHFILNWPNMQDEYDGNLPIIKCQ